jgi:hypothetical protein
VLPSASASYSKTTAIRFKPLKFVESLVEALGSTINSPLLRRVLVNSWVRWRFRPFPPGSRVLVNEARMSKVAFIQRNYVHPLIISAQMMESEISEDVSMALLPYLDEKDASPEVLKALKSGRVVLNVQKMTANAQSIFLQAEPLE